MKNVVAVVLGGGRGTRLQPLTIYRSKPAVPLAGKYRLIDIPLSNCLNSGLNQIYVLTQIMSGSLHRHIRGTYNFDVYDGGFVEILAAQQTFDCNTEDWFQGTADAVRKNLRYLSQPEIDHVLILLDPGSDHAVRQIDQGVHDKQQERVDHDHSHRQGVVTLGGCLDEMAAHSWQRKDLLEHQRAGQDSGGGGTQVGDDWQDRPTQRVANDHFAGGQTFCIGGTNVVQAQNFQHTSTRQTGNVASKGSP